MPKCKTCGKGNPFLKLDANGECLGCQAKVFRDLPNSTYVENAKNTSSTQQISCPKCKSINLQVMGQDHKGFSVGKAVAGTVLAGGVGALAGFAGKKGKYDMFCSDCGHRFQVK